MNVSRAQGILGIDSDATPAEIKKAYRQLALQHHPDKGGDKNKFQEISRAYKRLTDPDEDDLEEGKFVCLCAESPLFVCVCCAIVVVYWLRMYGTNVRKFCCC